VLLVATSATMESTSIMVLVPSFAPPILIVPNLVMDVILLREGATKKRHNKIRENLGIGKLIKVSTIPRFFSS
jgi:hypothetical protein